MNVLLIHGPTRTADLDDRALDDHTRAQPSMTIRTAAAEVGYDIARRERPDLIALDLTASFGNAWTICRLLRADPRTAGIPVVVLAGHEGSETAAHARLAGVRAIVSRPRSVDSFGVVIRNALG